MGGGESGSGEGGGGIVEDQGCFFSILFIVCAIVVGVTSHYVPGLSITIGLISLLFLALAVKCFTP